MSVGSIIALASVSLYLFLIVKAVQCCIPTAKTNGYDDYIDSIREFHTEGGTHTVPMTQGVTINYSVPQNNIKKENPKPVNAFQGEKNIMVIIMDMTDLTQLPGVGENTAEKMKEGGILTIMGVATATPSQMKDAAGITEKSARKLISAARELCDLGFALGTDLDVKEQKEIYIPTYCSAIDTLLGGGLRLGTTMEAFGEFASGKTNISHLLAVSTIKNFPESYVVWIDTENTFSAKRIRAFCEGLGVSVEHALDHIKVGKSMSSDHQILLTESIEKNIVQDKIDVKLLIIDSLMNHFRSEYLGRGALASRQQIINGYLSKVGKLAATYNLAVYFTNQIQSDPGMSFGDPNKAIGGNIVAHFATTRVYMRKGAKGSRKMILKDSPDLPEGEANFMITENKLEAIEIEEKTK